MTKTGVLGIVLGLALGGSSSEASILKSKKTKPEAAAPKAEVYSALDSDGAPEPIELMPPLNQPQNTQAAPSTKVASRASAARGTQMVKYESVPNSQRDSISKRLKIIDRLVTDYGRAYDYRNHTTQELEAILERLDSAQAKASQPAPQKTAAPQSSNSEVEPAADVIKSSDAHSEPEIAPAPAIDESDLQKSDST